MKRKVHSYTAYHFILTENYNAPKPNERWRRKKTKQKKKDLKWSQVTFIKLKQIQDGKKCILFYVNIFQMFQSVCVYMGEGEAQGTLNFTEVEENSFFSFLFLLIVAEIVRKHDWTKTKESRRVKMDFFPSLLSVIWPPMFECTIHECNSLFKHK